MKLALVISSLRGGGAERVLATLAEEFAASGHEVTVITESSTDHDHYRLGPAISRIALNVEWQTSTWTKKLVANVRRLRRLRKGIVSTAAERVIVFGETTNLRTLLSCMGTGVPVIISERVDPRQYRIPHAWDWMRRKLYPRAAAVVVQTESVAQWARALVTPRRVYVIANPVRIPQPHPARPPLLPHGRVVIGIGRLTGQKGFSLLIKAFLLSGLAGRGWHLVILGEGPDRGALQAQVRDLGLRGHISFPGLVASPEAWLQHADLFVLSSLFEGFPNALLEAMACGVAAIAFDCPSGPAEIIKHDQTGLLLPAGDVGALAAALADLACDPERRDRLARAARADVTARFALSTIAKEWLSVLVDDRIEQDYA